MAKKKLTYESALLELEEILISLEDNNLPLKDLVKDYSRGMELLAFCNNELTSAEQEIRKIAKLSGGKVVEENLVIEGE